MDYKKIMDSMKSQEEKQLFLAKLKRLWLLDNDNDEQFSKKIVKPDFELRYK